MIFAVVLIIPGSPLIAAGARALARGDRPRESMGGAWFGQQLTIGRMAGWHRRDHTHSGTVADDGDDPGTISHGQSTLAREV